MSKPVEKFTNGSGTLSVPNRRRSSWPIMAIAVIFVLVTFFTWHGTWFGRSLSDKEVAEYLSDEQKPRHVQQALWQIGDRIVAGDVSVKQWYGRIVQLAHSPVTEIRQVDAMVMGQDNTVDEFHNTLKTLLNDSEPIVRRNAALALVRFGDVAGHDEIVSILEPYTVKARDDGTVVSVLGAGSQINLGSLLVRINHAGLVNEMRSPLPGTIEAVSVNEGSTVGAGANLVSIKPDPNSVWEALRALYLIGRPSDLSAIEAYGNGITGMPDRVKDQARHTAQAIREKDRR
jgi:biotin carboxyl carrier protein